MKIFCFFIGLFVSCALFSQRNDLLWLKHVTGVGNSIPTAIVIDAAGNHYIAGNFTTTISVESNNYTSVGGQDIYVIKYNNQGQALWTITIGGTSAENVNGLALSPDGSFLYVGGQFQSASCSFGSTNLSTSGVNDVFLAKYQTSNGNLVWAIKSAYGTNQQLVGNLTVDPSGNIVQIGKYIDNVTFYGGTVTLNSPFVGIQQNYVSKFDQNGNLIWAKQFTGDNSNSYIRNVSADNNYYYFSGLYAGTFNLDANVLNSTSNTRDMILFRTDLNGNVQWYRKVTGTGEDYIIRHHTDFSSFQYVTGYYSSPTLTIDSTATVTSLKNCPNVGSNDIFTACYSYDGTLQWVRAYGSTGSDLGLGVFANADHVIFTGSYTGNISFGSFNLTNSSTDAYMLETDRNGNVLGVNRGWGTNTESCENGTIDANNANLFVGSFNSTTFNLSNKTLTNPSAATYDMFFAKFGRIILTFNVTNNLCYGDANGSIDLTVSGDGLAPYSYQWSGPYGFTSNNEDISNLPAGWYKVTVTDANNIKKIDSAYVAEGNAILLVFNTTNTSCYGIHDGSIDLSVSGGASPYSFVWSTGQNTEDITGLMPGTYYVTVTDANMCTTTGSSTITSPAALNIIEVISPPSCVPGNDASIDITVLGGTAPFSFLWSTGSTTEDLSSLSVGSYSVTVTDFNNCTISKTFQIVNPWAPTISAIVNAPSCSPGNDGSIDVIISGGTIPYSFIWNDGDINEDKFNLSAGTYSITVTDANNCSAVKSNIIVPVSNPPSLSYIAKKPSCNPGSDGEIDLIVYNGTMPFTYQWNNGATTQDISALIPAQYSVTVSDSKNCTATLTIPLTIDSPLVSITYNGNTTFCQGNTLMLYATNSNGFSFEWQLNGNSIANSNVPVWAANQTGNYSVVATNASGCKGYSNTVSINVLPNPTITINASSNFICEGTPVLLTANGALNYVWSSGSTQNPIQVQPSSTTTYTVTGTDANGCKNTAQSTITVNQKPVISGIVNNENCNNGNGSINITVTGGQTPYSYSWSNGATTEDISNLNDGTYTVTVTTAFNCTQTYSATVLPFIPLQASINTHSLIIFCQQIPNGEAHVVASNGKSPYTYQWSNGVNTSYNTQIGVGTTYVTVTDQCNHTVVDSIKVTSLPPLQIQITSSEPATCLTSADGEATVVTINGVPPFTYAWSNSSNTTPNVNNLPVGMQYVTVTDACGSKVDSVLIDHLPSMQASILYFTQVSCSGANDGSAAVSILDGVPPFSYQWSNGETTATATQLSEGFHAVTVTDACGWTTLSVTITAPTPLNINITDSSAASCSNISDGTAFVTAINGTLPYTYLWSSGETNSNATHLSAGWNYVTVSDACTTLVDSVFITIVPPLSASISFINDATCKHTNDGKAFVITENGVPPFQYTWSNSTSTSNTALDLPVGWNYVTVSDICTTIKDSVYIGYRPPLNPVLTVTPSKCSFDSSGSASIQTFFGVPPFNYLWSTSSTDTAIYNLPVGNYSVTISDFCNDTVITFNVTHQKPLSISIVKNNPTCYKLSNGSITLIAENGVQPISYSWANHTSTNPTLPSLSAGWYRFTVSDYCISIIDSTLLTEPSPLGIITNITDATMYSINDGSIEITTVGGTPPYQYQWSNNQTTEDINNLLPGNYYLTITDIHQCQFVDTFYVGYKASFIEIYNAFTPNGDGKNDVWNIKNIEHFPNCEVVVYDQWGVKVFESDGYTKPWDGTYKDKPLPAGVYYYVIDLKNNEKAITGSLTILK
ncbi:MAG: gliding motility-associated C-terminal domain-containing protein [Bacteroidales bacterium]|nr:gliding motility-associated C-terminal domain-containing protein [Bacteroidales bacterium]